MNLENTGDRVAISFVVEFGGEQIKEFLTLQLAYMDLTLITASII